MRVQGAQILLRHSNVSLPSAADSSVLADIAQRSATALKGSDPSRNRQNTASGNSQISLAVTPVGVVPGRCGSSRSQRSSETTNRCSFIQTSLFGKPPFRKFDSAIRPAGTPECPRILVYKRGCIAIRPRRRGPLIQTPRRPQLSKLKVGKLSSAVFSASPQPCETMSKKASSFSIRPLRPLSKESAT